MGILVASYKALCAFYVSSASVKLHSRRFKAYIMYEYMQ